MRALVCYGSASNHLDVQGVSKKNFTHGISLISLAINMLESWNIIHWKDGIHSMEYKNISVQYLGAEI